MMAPKRYDIVTLPDFLKVPEDRMSSCLADFKIYLEYCRELQGVDGIEPIKFVWVDDGFCGISELTLTFGSGAEREDS